MEFNRVSACKALLQSGYDPDLPGKPVPLEGREAFEFLNSVGMKPWKRGAVIELDPVFMTPKGGLDERTLQPWMQEKVFVLVDSVELLWDVADEAVKAGACVIDIESQGLDTRVYNGKPVHRIVGFALCYDGEIGYYVPVRHVWSNEDIANPENGNVPWDAALEQIQRILNGCVTIYHNASFDQEIMWAEGLVVPEEPDKFDDTQVMAWLIDSNRKRLGLKFVSDEVLGMKMLKFKDLFQDGEKNPRFEFLSPDEGYVYASSDSICTYLLWAKFKEDPLLAKQKIIHKVEKMLIPVLRRMERNRVRIDVDYLLEMDKGLAAQCDKMVEDIRRLCEQPDLSVDSAKQLGEVLFDKLNIPNAGRTDSGKQWKTDRQSLEELDKKLSGKYPALNMVVKYRQLQKLRGTYISNLTQNLDEFNEGRFGIMATGAPTGRFAAPGGDPRQGFTGVNSQAVPKVKKNKPNIRKAFVARPGFVIAAIDFAGVELRIAGNLSREAKWITEFNHLDCKRKYDGDYEVIGWSPLWHHCPYCRKKMGDVHSQTAEAVFGSASEEHRNKSKGVNFGILYGAGGATIGQNVGVSKDEGFRIVKQFKAALPAIASWIRKQHKLAHKTKQVKTAFGRIRLIPEVESEIKRIVSFGERTSVNSPVQGTSADITKIAMVGCDKLIRSRGWEEHCRILLTVHDEIVFEVRETMIDEILPALGLAMCKCQPSGWKIPLTVDIEYGKNWGEVTNVWKPPAPKVRPRREGIPPLWDDEDFTDVPAPEEPPPAMAVEKKGSSPEPETSVSPPSTPDSTPEEEEAPTPAPAPEPAPASPVAPENTDSSEEFEYILKRPYTKGKLRKLEALFILAGEGTVRLRLLSDAGQDLLGGRKILVDPVYFRYKASEWGL